MAFIDNWLKKRTISALMLVFGACGVTGSSANIWISNVDISFAVYLLSILVGSRVIMEAARRDKLIHMWGNKGAYVIVKKDEHT